MIKSPPTELCVFTFYWIAFVVIFQTKLVSFESEFGSIRYLRKRKGFFRVPNSGIQLGTPSAATGKVGSQPGTPGAATGNSGSQPGTPGAATGLSEEAEARRFR